MVSNFSKSSKAGKEILKTLGTSTFVTFHSIIQCESLASRNSRAIVEQEVDQLSADVATK